MKWLSWKELFQPALNLTRLHKVSSVHGVCLEGCKDTPILSSSSPSPAGRWLRPIYHVPLRGRKRGTGSPYGGLPPAVARPSARPGTRSSRRLVSIKASHLVYLCSHPSARAPHRSHCVQGEHGPSLYFICRPYLLEIEESVSVCVCVCVCACVRERELSLLSACFSLKLKMAIVPLTQDHFKMTIIYMIIWLCILKGFVYYWF